MTDAQLVALMSVILGQRIEATRAVLVETARAMLDEAKRQVYEEAQASAKARVRESTWEDVRDRCS